MEQAHDPLSQSQSQDGCPQAQGQPEQKQWMREGYKFVIPVAVLSQCGEKTITYKLRHPFLRPLPVEHKITVVGEFLPCISVDVSQSLCVALPIYPTFGPPVYRS
eukprot:1160460-Pelagomonas_calceolata.AAC.8